MSHSWYTGFVRALTDFELESAIQSLTCYTPTTQVANVEVKWERMKWLRIIPPRIRRNWREHAFHSFPFHSFSLFILVPFIAIPL